MGKRSGIPDTDEALDALPLVQVEAELARVQMRQRIPNQTAYLRKAFLKQEIWLTKYIQRRQEKDA